MTTVNKKQMKKYVRIAKKATKYEQNEIYKFLKKHSQNAPQGCGIEIEHLQMVTSTPSFSYYSEATTLSLPDGSHIRFKSRAKSVDISRVWVSPENHGRKLGTLLMGVVLLPIFKYVMENPEKPFPKIVLECTGSVGYGENQQDTDVEKQVKFFSKFGFVFDRYDSHDVVHMKLDDTKYFEWVSPYYEQAFKELKEMSN